MGDWESMFGAGVSAESVIDSIRSSADEWEAERGEEDLAKARRQRAQKTAFLGNQETKNAFICKISSSPNSSGICEGEGSFWTVENAASYGVVETTFGIPAQLLRILEAVDSGAKSELLAHKYEGVVHPWVVECIEAIIPGTDIRFVAPKLAAHIARVALDLAGDNYWSSFKRDEIRAATRPALDVIYARARGIIVQNFITSAAIKNAFDRLTGDWEGRIQCGDLDPNEMVLAIVGTAAKLDSQSAALAAFYAAKAGSFNKGGSWIPIVTWGEISNCLIGLIKEAPQYQIRLVDLNDTVSSLGL